MKKVLLLLVVVFAMSCSTEAIEPETSSEVPSWQCYDANGNRLDPCTDGRD